MNSEYFQFLLETVRNRAQTSIPFRGSVPLFHKDTPISKFVTKDLKSHPLEQMLNSRFLRKDAEGIPRGKIGTSKKIKYSFHPRIKRTHNKTGDGQHTWAHVGSSESGRHIYTSKSPTGKKVEITIHHDMNNSRSGKRKKGILTSSDIVFSVDNKIDVGSKSKKTGAEDAIGIYRTVLSAVKHHLKSQNPDEMTFSTKSSADKRDRAKLYTYLAKKIIGTKYHLGIKKKSKDETNFSIIKRKTQEVSRLLKAQKQDS